MSTPAQRLPQLPLGADDLFHAELQAIRGKLSKKNGPAIYRPGQQPVWAAEAEDAAAKQEEELRDGMRGQLARKAAQPAVRGELKMSSSLRRPVAAALVSGHEIPPPARDGRDSDGDERMEEDDDDDDDDNERGMRRHRSSSGGSRRPIAAAVLVASWSSAASAAASAGVSIDTSQLEVAEVQESDEDADAAAEREIAERRRRARAKAAQREAEEEAQLKREEEELKQKQAAEAEEEEEEDEEDDESEYEDDSDEERRKMLFKPVFRSKSERATLADRDRIDAEYDQLESDRAARKIERKQQGKELVLQELQRDLELEKAKAASNLVDSDDDGMGGVAEPIDEEMELDLWKLRELKRIKRDRAERAAYDEEQALIERRRGMTDAEIAADNKLLGVERLQVGHKPKNDEEDGASGMKFMQKFYHKGGFFQDDASIAQAGNLAKRDFQQATGMDRTTDMQLMPKVMQVKKFAMKGRTKYTHLADQDTTRREENPWSSRNALVDRTQVKGAGAVIPDSYRKKQKS